MSDLCVDLYCGLGGWAEGFLAEGYDVVGFDIERHDYGTGGYPGQLVLQDVLSLHGSQFKRASVIVASPPCQKYSYMAMPWSKAKGRREWYRHPAHPERIMELNELFNACFRIQREASQAAGRHIPLIVENVRGAQPWVGRAAWHFGSYYLWGDVPALMPIAAGQKFNPDGTNHPPGSWFAIADSKKRGVKVALSGRAWYADGLGAVSSKSPARKAASAQIAKIPFPLARHIAQCFKKQRVAFVRLPPDGG